MLACSHRRCCCCSVVVVVDFDNDDAAVGYGGKLDLDVNDDVS